MTDKILIDRALGRQALDYVEEIMKCPGRTAGSTQRLATLAYNILRAALAEQPEEQGLDDDGDALTIAYLHGFSEGKKATEASQPENVAEDAYNHACEEMKRWQRERRKSGKEVGTTGSLCDGIAWLYQYVDSLERQARKALRTALAEPDRMTPKELAERLEPVAWDGAQKICDLPAVDEAIRALLEDETNDNAVCLVRAILAAAPTPPAEQAVPQGWREFLNEIEWANCSRNDNGDGEPYCVCCDAWQSQGHKPDCKFAAMLAAAPEAPQPTTLGNLRAMLYEYRPQGVFGDKLDE